LTLCFPENALRRRARNEPLRVDAMALAVAFD